MTLTEEERHKFAAYCAEEARSYDGLAKEAAKLQHGEIMAIPMRHKALAFGIVYKHLATTEEVRI